MVPEKIATIVSGIAAGCVQAGCALVGGETAEHPGVMRADEYDVSGTGIGMVNADGVLGADRVKPGDVLIALGRQGCTATDTRSCAMFWPRPALRWMPRRRS